VSSRQKLYQNQIRDTPCVYGRPFEYQAERLVLATGRCMRVDLAHSVPPAWCGGRSNRASVRTLDHLGPHVHARFEPSRVRTLIYVCMHVPPWFESILSSNVSITCGARTHTSRNGGFLVNRGPPFRFPGMSPSARGLPPCPDVPGSARESRMAGRLRPLSPFWLSGSLGPIGEPTPCPARRGRAVGIRRWNAVLRPPSCACNGRGVSSSNLFAQNATWSQARVMPQEAK
jgi:hypothetical protein